MRILPVLVSAEYNAALKLQMYGYNIKKALPSKLYILNSKFYPVEFKMEPGGNDALFITRQHFRTKDGWNKKNMQHYVPGFCIIDLKPGESEELYEIKYRANNVGDYQELSYFSASDKRIVKPDGYPHCGVFFDLPSFEFEEKRGGLVSNYITETDIAVLGSVNVGYTEIACFKKEKKEKNNPELKCYLKVLPSSMTEKVFGKMIDDILAVHRQLLGSKNGKQSISLNKDWNTNLLEIGDKINRLENCFNLIQKRYYTRLKLMPCNINKRLVKKFNDKLIMQFALEPSKQKFKSEKLYEDNNIYEHRMLLWALNGLSKFINVVSHSIEEKDTIEKGKNNYNKSRFLSQYNLKNLADTDLLIQALDNCNRDFIFDKFIECNSDNLQESVDNHDLFKEKISYQDFCIYDEDLREFEPVTLTSCGFEGTNFFLSYTCEYYNEAREKKDLRLRIISNDVRWQELIYLEFSKIKKKYNQNIASSDLSGCLLKIAGEYEVSEDRKTYYFYAIESFSINNEECNPRSTVEEAKAHLKRLYTFDYDTDDNIYIRREERIEKTTFNLLAREIEAEKSKYSSIDEETNNEAINREELDKKILKLKQYPFLDRLAEKGDETWTLTQKFINDPNYKTAYSIFHELNENYHFSELNSPYSIIHQKVNDLYEYWIFIKILEVLMLIQKWELIEVNDKSSADAQREISVIISKILSTQNNALQNSKLVFSHPLRNGKEAKLTFYYNHEIWFKEKIGYSDHKTPDYHFVIEYKDDNNKLTKYHFCLDAKYRNYNSQKGKWAEDINKVCIDNYLNKLNTSLTQSDSHKGIEEKYIAAFIVHSDADSYSYWGGNLHKLLKIDDILEFDEISRGKRFSPKRYPKHRIGSFPLLPNSIEKVNLKNFERNLLTFFTMIFEYHCKLYNVCWECGNVNPKEHDIKGDGISHCQYLCENCNRFWVKYHCQNKENHHPLIKHKYNYHKESIHNTYFLVKCPECGNEYK